MSAARPASHHERIVSAPGLSDTRLAERPLVHAAFCGGSWPDYPNDRAFLRPTRTAGCSREGCVRRAMGTRYALSLRATTPPDSGVLLVVIIRLVNDWQRMLKCFHGPRCTDIP